MDAFQTFDWNMDSMWFNRYLFYLQCSVWALCSMLYLGMFRHASNLPSGFGTEYLFLLRLHSVSLGGVCLFALPFFDLGYSKDRALLYRTRGSSTRAAKSCVQTDGQTSKPFWSVVRICVQKLGCFSETHPNISETLWVRNWVKTQENSHLLFFNPLSSVSVLTGSCKAQTPAKNHNSWGNSIILSLLLEEVKMTRCMQSLWMEK